MLSFFESAVHQKLAPS